MPARKTTKRRMGDARQRAVARQDRDRLEKRFLQHQLALAADIQALLLPRQLPRLAGYEVHAACRPCEDVGGDYYDVIEIDENHLGLLVADVAGHGFPGTLVMAQVRAFMRAEAGYSLSPKEVLVRLNRHLYGEIPKGLFVTMCFGVLDLQRSTFTVASAGHNALYWWRSSAREIEAIRPGGLMLAVDSGKRFERFTQETVLEIALGDRLVLYTDGVTETMDRRGRQFGDGRLQKVIRDSVNRSAREFVERLLASLDRFRDNGKARDDVSVVCLRRVPEPTSEFGYLDSLRFIRCRACDTVNVRQETECVSCGTELPRRPPFGGETGGPLRPCPACKRMLREEVLLRGCPYCMRRLCARCENRSALLGLYCPECAPSER